MVYERRNWAREDESWSFLGLVAAVALGVFIGSLAAVFTWEAVTTWRVERAMREAAVVLDKHTAKSREEDRRRSAALAQAQNLRAEREAAEQAARNAAMQAERDRVARKEAAWQRFFQPTAACRLDAINTVCANAHMAAKKRFEEQYRD